MESKNLSGFIKIAAGGIFDRDEFCNRQNAITVIYCFVGELCGAWS
jgi:hypothetical protein